MFGRRALVSSSTSVLRLILRAGLLWKTIVLLLSLLERPDESKKVNYLRSGCRLGLFIKEADNSAKYGYLLSPFAKKDF